MAHNLLLVAVLFGFKVLKPWAALLNPRKMNSIEYMVVHNKRTDLFNVFHGDMNDPSTWVWKSGQFNTEDEAKEECYHLEMYDIGNFDLH